MQTEYILRGKTQKEMLGNVHLIGSTLRQSLFSSAKDDSQSV